MVCFFVSFFLSDSSVRGHACECADFDSGVDEPPKGILLKAAKSVLGWVAVMALGSAVACVARWRGTSHRGRKTGSATCARAVLHDRATTAIY